MVAVSNWLRSPCPALVVDAAGAVHGKNDAAKSLFPQQVSLPRWQDGESVSIAERSYATRRVDNEDLQALAGVIIDEADRLAALANRLLHHDGAPQLGPVNIHRLLERLCDLLLAEPAPPQLHHDYDPSVPDLHGDADRLQQVLLNLARNALQAGARTLILRTRVEHGAPSATG